MSLQPVDLAKIEFVSIPIAAITKITDGALSFQLIKIIIQFIMYNFKVLFEQILVVVGKELTLTGTHAKYLSKTYPFQKVDVFRPKFC